MDDDEEAEADSTSGTHYEPNTGFGVTLVDADNAFNRTNLYMALETVASRLQSKSILAKDAQLTRIAQPVPCMAAQ